MLADLLLALSVVFGSLLVFAGSLYALKRSKRIYMKGWYGTFNGRMIGHIRTFENIMMGGHEMVIPMKWKPIVRGVDVGEADQVVVKVTIPKFDVKFHIPDIKPSPDAKRMADMIDDIIKKRGGYVRP